MKKAYTAIFTKDVDEIYYVKFPDLKSCFTDGESVEEAVLNAESALNLFLVTEENYGRVIPEPSLPNSFTLDENSFACLIIADTQKYRKKMKDVAVRRTVSLPKWLDEEVKEKNLNCSKILQNALYKLLDIE